jgi:hypothetical protein
VSSDLSLDVIGDESKIFLTCQALSRDHQGQAMTAKAELEVLVLSKSIYLFTLRARFATHYGPKTLKHQLANIFCLFLQMLPKKNKKEKKVLLPIAVSKSAAQTVFH